MCLLCVVFVRVYVELVCLDLLTYCVLLCVCVNLFGAFVCISKCLWNVFAICCAMLFFVFGDRSLRSRVLFHMSLCALCVIYCVVLYRYVLMFCLFVCMLKGACALFAIYCIGLYCVCFGYVVLVCVVC